MNAINLKSFVYLSVLGTLVSCGNYYTHEVNENGSRSFVVDQLDNNDSIELVNYLLYTKKYSMENEMEYNTNVIADFEKERDTNSILKFLENNISSIFKSDNYPFTPSELVEYIYQIDINDDELKDVIYHGPTGGEQNVCVIFLNQNETYLEVFRQFQYIFGMEFTENRVSRISLTNPGCCADPQIIDYYYHVIFKDNKPIFELISTRGYLSGFESPKNKYKNEKKFTIIKDGSKLRNDCYELDSEHPYYGKNGNALTSYQKGSTGRALSEKNENGMVWVYVLMDKKSFFDDNDFPAFMEQPIELYGWIKKQETDLK
jgi:hypothetical protein